jgi:hypothetical protein
MVGGTGWSGAPAASIDGAGRLCASPSHSRSVLYALHPVCGRTHVIAILFAQDPRHRGRKRRLPHLAERLVDEIAHEPTVEVRVGLIGALAHDARVEFALSLLQVDL